MQTKILKCHRYPNLVCRLEKKTQRNFSFPCSLNPSNIPSPTANWKVSLDLLPVVTEQKKFNQASWKKEGNDGQQRKAFKMLQSRKIVSVNVLTYGSTLFVKVLRTASTTNLYLFWTQQATESTLLLLSRSKEVKIDLF